MNPHHFLDSSSTHFTILVFLVSSFWVCQTVVSHDSKFEACAPRSCGNGPMIKYPFWVHEKHQPFCGYPGFGINCTKNSTVLTLSYDEYIIRDIFYPNHSLLVVNSVVNSSKCPTPLHNLSLNRTPFGFPPDNINMLFLYNCTKNPEGLFKYSIDCGNNRTLHDSFVVFQEELEKHRGNLSESCETVINVPLNLQDDVKLFDSLMEMKYTKLLSMGFLLNWSAQNCSSCERSGGRCGFEHNEFVCFCRNKPHPRTCSSGRNHRLKAVIGICAGIGGIAIAFIPFFIYFRHYKRKNAPLLCRCTSSDPAKPDFEKGNYPGLHIFCYDELLKATENFNESKLLGDGGYGTVYHGTLCDGRAVAVKRLYESNCKRLEQFMNEIEILARLRHQNLVMLYGCTSRSSRELLIVYEYVPNGTIADHLHGDQAKPGALPWATRLKIATETASALAYLHASGIIHRDVKTTNILLDSNFSVKVADFGLSRLFPTNVSHISTAPQGTPGYVDPEYHQCYLLTDKSDVYSYGVVLIELISSKPAVDISRHRQDINLSTMAVNKILNNELHELVDTSLGYDSDPKVKKMIDAVAELAFQCLQSGKDLRPNMAEVLDILRGIENGSGKVPKEEQKDAPLQPDDVTQLKNNSVPYSPDSVIVKWVSASSASNDSMAKQ